MNISDKLTVHLPPDILGIARELARLAAARTLRSAVVGGVVRDLLLGRSVLDADIMLESPAAPVVEELARTREAKLVSHERFMTFALHFPTGRKVDVVTAREETYASPGALPKVTASTFEKDLSRRDFSINAIACLLDPARFGDLLDPFNGHADIHAKLVRALHPGSFQDDPTRVVRAARFAGRLGFQIEGKTREWIQAALKADLLARLTPVRRRHEFEAILKEPDPMPALVLLKSWGALAQLHADWDGMNLAGFAEEILQRAADSPDDRLVRRLAAWFRPSPEKQRNAVLSDLGFEKTIKKQVQDLLKA